MAGNNQHIEIFDSTHEVPFPLPVGMACIYWNEQIIIATEQAQAEAERRTRALRKDHPVTIKRNFEELLPETLFNMFAENWQPIQQ